MTNKKPVDTFVRWLEENKVIHGIECFDLLDTLTGATYRFMSELGRELKKQEIEHNEKKKEFRNV